MGSPPQAGVKGNSGDSVDALDVLALIRRSLFDNARLHVAKANEARVIGLIRKRVRRLNCGFMRVKTLLQNRYRAAGLVHERLGQYPLSEPLRLLTR